MKRKAPSAYWALAKSAPVPRRLRRGYPEGSDARELTLPWGHRRGLASLRHGSRRRPTRPTRAHRVVGDEVIMSRSLRNHDGQLRGEPPLRLTTLRRRAAWGDRGATDAARATRTLPMSSPASPRRSARTLDPSRTSRGARPNRSPRPSRRPPPRSWSPPAWLAGPRTRWVYRAPRRWWAPR